MRIALVAAEYVVHGRSQVALVVQERAEALAADGHDVHVLTTGDRTARVEEVNGVSIHYTASRPRAWGEDFADECERICKRLAPRLIHLDNVGHHPWWRGRPGGARTVALTLHGTTYSGYLTRLNLFRAGLGKDVPLAGERILSEAALFRTFDRVVATNPFEHRVLEEMYGVLCPGLVWSPIPAYFYRQRSELPVTPSFICVAAVNHEIRGWPDAEKAAKETGLPVKLVEPDDREKMPYQYDAATALLLPTYMAQGFDLAVAECLARQRPVILYGTGAYYNLARDRHAHRWIREVRTGDVAGLCEAMREAGNAKVAPDAANRWHPDEHVRNWLAATGGAL